MTELSTTDAEKAYMRNDGCPYCKSKLDYDNLEFIDGEVFRNVYCTNRECNAEFQEVWQLSSVQVDCEPFKV